MNGMRKRSSWLLTCSTAGAAPMFTAVVKERGSPPDLAKIDRERAKALAQAIQTSLQSHDPMRLRQYVLL